MASIKDFDIQLTHLVSHADAALMFNNGKFVPEESRLGEVCAVAEGKIEIQIPFGTRKVAIVHTFEDDAKGELKSECYVNVTVAENAELDLFEVFMGCRTGVLNFNAGVKLVCGSGSRMNRLGATLLGDRTTTTASLAANLMKDATLNLLQISSASRMHQDNWIVELDEVGASANVRSLSVGRGKNQSHLNSSIRHNVGNTKSFQQADGIFTEESRGEFSGHLYIDQDAQKSDAKQLSKNILLKSTAEVISKPQLEVLADDVKAAHGATVSNVNENEIFYLTSRGIDRTTATKLLLDGKVRHLAESFEKKSWLNQIAENLAERSIEGIL